MAFIPSQHLSSVLQRAKAGIWIERLQDDRNAFVCKIPETAIKAIFRGAPCSLRLAIVNAEGYHVLCLGFRVDDEPENPFTTIIASMSSEDLTALKQILDSTSTTLHCLNELNHPALSALCRLEIPEAHIALKYLHAAKPFQLTPSSAASLEMSDVLRIADAAMVKFQKEVYRSVDGAVDPQISMTSTIQLSLELWRPTEIFEADENALSGPFQIDDADEGPKLEKLAFAVLSSVYGARTYRSPSVRGSSVVRELTDVLAFDPSWICLVESKATSVLGADPRRSSRRRAASATKQVIKALKQLRGAIDNVRSSKELAAADGTEILLADRDRLPAHGIVLLSEMYAFIDWREIARQVVALSDNEGDMALFHVVDLLELSDLARQSDSAAMFNNFLVQRWLRVKMKGTAYGRIVRRVDEELT